MNLKLIGFCGYARSGKDTAAKALIDLGWMRVAFADALKADVAYAIQRSFSVIGGGALCETLIEDHKEEFRPLLVEYGRAMRRVRASYWIDRLMRHVAGAQDLRKRFGEPEHKFVITDVRYQNEVDAIHAAGGKVIMILRSGVLPANAEEADSFSRVAPDVIISNDGDIRGLHLRVLEQAHIWGLTNPDPAG